MRRISTWVGVAATVALAMAACQPADQTTSELDIGFSVPVEYYTLDNGLRVVLSPDHTAPVVTVAVYYTSASGSSRGTAPASLICSST